MRKPSIKTYRRLCQLLIIILFIAVPILNKERYSLLYGNLLAFHFWVIPFADPLAVLQLTLKNLHITFENFIGAFLPLLLAFFVGTVFCSWLCPFGFFSEMALHLRRKLLPRSTQIKAQGSDGVVTKIIIFTVGIAFFLFFSTTPVLNQMSLPAWYTRFFQYLFGQGYVSLSIFALLAVLIIEFMADKRIWCRYICPQSVLIIFAKRLNRKRLMVHFEPKKCICKNGIREHCTSACTLSLHPKTVGRVKELECTNCGDCIMACQKMGCALQFSSQRSVTTINKQDKK